MLKALYIVLLLTVILIGGLASHAAPVLATDNVTLTDNTTMLITLTSEDLAGVADGMTVLAASLNNTSDVLLLIFEVLVVLGILVFSLWKKEVILYVIAGLVTLFAALSWVRDLPEIAIPLIGLGLYQLLNAILSAVGTNPATGSSHVKAIVGKLKGMFRS